MQKLTTVELIPGSSSSDDKPEDEDMGLTDEQKDKMLLPVCLDGIGH